MAIPAGLMVMFVSPGVMVDGGGFYIDANGHIHRVPPWNPETLIELTAAAGILAHATQIKDGAVRAQFEKLAQSVISAKSKEITGAVQQGG